MPIYHEEFNRGLWAAGLLLQLALLIALLVRKQARRFPVFTVLLAFYLVRTSLLYALAGHMSSGEIALLNDGLSSLDLLLQLMVAAEIAQHLVSGKCGVSGKGGWNWRHGVLGFGILGLAIGAGWLAGFVYRASPRVSVDRGQVFSSCVMILLFGCALWSRASGPVRRIVEGFALYGLVSLLAQAGRARAVFYRDTSSYVGWSYAVIAAYLFVVSFWLLTVKTDGDRTPYRFAKTSM